MRLGITVLDDDGGHLRALQRWLLRDPDSAGATLTLRGRNATPGAMGPGLDLIDVVLSNVVALGGLLVAVATWRQSRANAPRVLVEREGVTVTVSGTDAEQIERLVRQLTAPQTTEPGDGTPAATAATLDQPRS
ncbi:effector-associated constant component EACC1 [Streptomyces bicolor]|uniref:effector-associated constant component EACC1 n=1 Tax=Streptomyces bicolor TaxID=66874 RepID=UPI00068CEE6B|nr:hypothetical protein [Streptomyces bicolor]